MKATIIFWLLLFQVNLLSAQSPTWAWAQASNNNGATWPYDLCTDALGNIYVCGYFKDSITLGNTKLLSNGDRDIFVAKYDGSGNVLWAINAGGTGADEAKGITVDASGIYVTGYFSTTAQFGSQSLISIGFKDIFVCKYDYNSNLIWLKRAGSDYPDEGIKIKSDKKGHIYLTGIFGEYGSVPSVYRTATFDTCTVTSNGNTDVFIAKYDTDGNASWVRNGGTLSSDLSASISIDTLGNSYLFGSMSTTNASFGTITIQPFTSGFLVNNLFIVKYDSMGVTQWGHSIGAFGSQTSTGSELFAGTMDVAPNGNIYLTGAYHNCSLRLHSGLILTNNFTNREIFTAKYNKDGNVIWGKKAGGGGDDHATSLVIDANENSYITGNFGSTHFIFDNDTLFKSGGYDLFVASYDSIGTVRWVKRGGDMGSEGGNSITCNSNGNEIVTTGYFGGSTTFDNIILNSTGGLSTYVAKLSSNTSIDELALSTVTIFPNPASETVTITSKTSGIEKVAFYNSTGAKTFEQTYNSCPQETVIRLGDFAPGLYIVGITTKKGIITQKVLLQH